MRNVGWAAVCLLALVAVGTTQDNKGRTNTGRSRKYWTARFRMWSSEFVPAAEAMPEDKFGFAPSNGEFKGVRTFAEQIKHVAAVNFIFGAAILGEKVPVDVGDESGPASLKTKAEIINYLKDVVCLCAQGDSDDQ